MAARSGPPCTTTIVNCLTSPERSLTPSTHRSLGPTLLAPPSTAMVERVLPRCRIPTISFGHASRPTNHRRTRATRSRSYPSFLVVASALSNDDLNVCQPARTSNPTKWFAASLTGSALSLISDRSNGRRRSYRFRSHSRSTPKAFLPRTAVGASRSDFSRRLSRRRPRRTCGSPERRGRYSPSGRPAPESERCSTCWQAALWIDFPQKI